MRLLKLTLTIGTFLCTQAFAADGDVFPYAIHKDTLDNGLQVVTVPFDSPGIVSFYVVVRVGSREEVEEGVTGFAHFFEHCMFRGTERFPKEAYNKKLQELAAAGNANTAIDRTLYYFTGNANDLDTMFDIESNRFRYLKYPEHGFKTEAGAVLGEYNKNFANPFRQLNEKVATTIFTKHTYSHTTMGFVEDIKDMPNQYEYSLKFFDRFYRPEYCTVMVVGDTTHEQVMSLSTKYFGDWERGKYVADIPAEPEQTAERSCHVTMPGSANLLAVYYRSPAFSDTKKDLIALNLLFELGFSAKSDIQTRLVQKEQKMRFIFPDITDTKDPYKAGLISWVYKLEDVPMVREEILAVIEKMKTVPVADKELADLKSRIRYGMAGGLNTSLAVGDALASYIWVSGDPESLNKEYALIDQITPADIMEMAKKYLNEATRTIATLSAEEEGR